ncbi:Hpt domain protein [Leptospira weilii str. 2006001853]|uniref:Hpt domain protein n=3 Tax=Leptospira weilii TaxID=28184 RepID=A0A828Z288_9LEPT|nr:Hpt domain protein [Leptospira weilii str. 2006001853]EMM74127.1 Hpt domain protein [Leptospira weilii str. 2006001855]EMN44301.1 Hpt domain protein [Leptospira weilii str. LNT 1234]
MNEVTNMLVDWNRLDSLKQSDDEDEIAWLKEMVESLLTNMEIRIKNIVHFTEEKKDIELQAELHQTKGVSANFGLEDLRTLVTEAEQFLKTGDQDRSYALSLKTTVVWEQTRDELKKKFGIF